MQRIGSSKFKLWSCVNLHGQGNAVLSIFGSEQNLLLGEGMQEARGRRQGAGGTYTTFNFTFMHVTQ